MSDTRPNAETSSPSYMRSKFHHEDSHKVQGVGYPNLAFHKCRCMLPSLYVCVQFNTKAACIPHQRCCLHFVCTTSCFFQHTLMMLLSTKSYVSVRYAEETDKMHLTLQLKESVTCALLYKHVILNHFRHSSAHFCGSGLKLRFAVQILFVCARNLFVFIPRTQQTNTLHDQVCTSTICVVIVSGSGESPAGNMKQNKK